MFNPAIFSDTLNFLTYVKAATLSCVNLPSKFHISAKFVTLACCKDFH